MLSLRLVPWRIQVLLELAFKISLVTTSDSSKHLVYIIHQDHDSFECFIPVLEGVEY